MTYDVLIAGSGIAGLYAALNFPDDTRVLVLSKKEASVCNSALAQGGVAAVMDLENDAFKLHVADTLIAGGYRNDLRSLEILVSEGPEDVKRLMKRLGVDFDRTPDGGAPALTLEGGHSRRRILHHKDSTGREMTGKLLAAVRAKSNITLWENTMLTGLTPGENGFIASLLQNDSRSAIGVGYVILSTGGIGRIYAYTTNSAISTGDGIALAHELGAVIKHLSWVQFHPTAFAVSAGRERFLITEAVRGEGGILLNGNGERFMERYDERLELAPRDVVSRSILREADRVGCHDFYLDIRHRGIDFIRGRFPMIYARCLEESVDITKEPIPVYPCQHYLMGGINVGVYGNTTVDRLYAAGECSHTGVHGINRLASNSLLEALVFARRTVYDISRRMRTEPAPPPSPPPVPPVTGNPAPAGYRTAIRSIMQQAWFVRPDPAAIAYGLREARRMLTELRTGNYAPTADYTEAKSLVTVGLLMLEELATEEGSSSKNDYWAPKQSANSI